MFYLKQCGKCNGDLHSTKDIYGQYIACLQCGRHLTDEQARNLAPKLLANPLMQNYYGKGSDVGNLKSAA